jgi:hypothetical protein
LTLGIDLCRICDPVDDYPGSQFTYEGRNMVGVQSSDTTHAVVMDAAGTQDGPTFPLPVPMPSDPQGSQCGGCVQDQNQGESQDHPPEIFRDADGSILVTFHNPGAVRFSSEIVERQSVTPALFSLGVACIALTIGLGFSLLGHGRPGWLR